MHQSADTAPTMPRWIAECYIGERYDDYFVLLSRSRDSDALEESNFHTALRMLDGESETVKIARSGHWLVGWVEQILIHESDAAKIELGNHILAQLEGYPVLDEDDYSMREAEEEDDDE